MRKIALMVLLVLHAALGACGGKQEPEVPLVADSATLRQVAQGNNEFAFDLYAKLNTNRDNLFFSPFSVFTALAMTFAGAAGETKRQMEQALHFPYNDETLHNTLGAFIQALISPPRPQTSSFPQGQLKIANSLWGQKGFGFQKDFLNLNRNFYGAALETLDFSSDPAAGASRINQWVAQETEGRIKDIINPRALSPATVLVLTNAIYFKAAWVNEFEKCETKDELFFCEDGLMETVPMMRQKELFAYYETEHLQVLRLGYHMYRRGRTRVLVSMVLLLPEAKEGLARLESTLTAQNVHEWTAAMNTRHVEVFLPKFRIESGFELKETLKAMRMTDAFQPGAADFGEMVKGQKEVWIDQVWHKAYVDVDEKGTEAAAATAVGALQGGSLDPPPVFRADHPFLFVIRDDISGSILFIGRVMKP